MGQTRRPFLLGSDTTLDPSKHCAERFEVTVRPWGRAPETEPVRGSVAAGGGAQSGTPVAKVAAGTQESSLLANLLLSLTADWS